MGVRAIYAVLMVLLGIGAAACVPARVHAQQSPPVVVVQGRELVNIESLKDALGNPVRPVHPAATEAQVIAQAEINSNAINLAFQRMRNYTGASGGRAASMFHGLYIPAKRFAVGPKIVTAWGYGGGSLYGTGSVNSSGTAPSSSNTNATSDLVKVSHFEEPVIEVPGSGTRLDGFTIYGWHQKSVATIPGGAITGASNDEPIVITSANHALVTGDQVRTYGVRGNQAANSATKAYRTGDGKWTVTVINANQFSLDGSKGSGDYLPANTPEAGDSQGLWIAPGKRYAAVGIRLTRGGTGSPGYNTDSTTIAFVGCEVGIEVHGDNNADNNHFGSIDAGVYGDAVRMTNENNTALNIAHLRAGGQLIGPTGSMRIFIADIDNVFNYRTCGGLNAGIVNTNMRCTILRTANVAPGAHSFNISLARFDQKHYRNRLLVMEQPRGARVRMGVQYASHGFNLNYPLVEWKHRGVIERVGGYQHPDIEIDCHQWRRDQAAGFPRRPIPGWPMPLPYTTGPFDSTKLWISAANLVGWAIDELPADKDPTRNPRRVSRALDASGTGNHLDEDTPGIGPWLWHENFNHRDTLYFENKRMQNARPSGLDRVTDLEIMFPIIIRPNSNGGTIIARDNAHASVPASSRGWGVRLTAAHEIEWYQHVGSTLTTHKSHALEIEKAYLCHIRRIGATGEVFILVDNAGGLYPEDFAFNTNNVAPTLTPEILTAGALNNGTTLSMGQVKSGAGWASTLEALVPELFVDTALLTREQLAERKRYLRAAYGVWEGTQLDDPPK